MFLFSSPNSTRKLIKGIITTAVGIIIVAVPDLSIDTVIKFLGLLLIIDGVINLLPAMIKKTKQQNMFVIVPRGTTSIIFGALLLLFPQLVVGIFVFVIGFILIVAGGSQLISQLSGRNALGFSWLIFVISLIAFSAGTFMFLFPKRISVAIVILTGLIIVLYGVGEIVWSFRIRKLQKQNPPEQPDIVDADYEEVE
jgi:uncharacterized membrane protein HdeD (DUF308 family)